MFESKKIIVEFVIHLMQRLYSKAPKTSPQQTENGDSRKKAGRILMLLSSMLDPLKDLEMGITCFQLTTVHLVVTFVVLLLVGGSIAMTALLLKSQNEESGKF